MKLAPFSKPVVKAIKAFPTHPYVLEENSYLQLVHHFLLRSNSFLEIGYQKGLVLEVCKAMNFPRSMHIDITNEKLKATPSENNRCKTIDSLTYLQQCFVEKTKFDFIFQDGAKTEDVRYKEYELIFEGNILSRKGVLLVDDYHYRDCRKALRRASKRYPIRSWVMKVVGRKRTYKMVVVKYEK